MTTTASTERRGRWLVLLLAAVLTAAVTMVLGLTTAGIASASTTSAMSSSSTMSASALQTRVGVSASDVILAVGVRDVIGAGQRRGEAVPGPGFVSGCCVASEDTAPLIKAGSQGGQSAGKAFPQSVRQQALEENPSTCVYCHSETNSPQVDHSIPRSRGGNATLDNAQTTCPWCNASKGARDFPVNPPPGYEGAWPPPWWGIEP